jgi:hypothetical protein
LPDKDGKKFSCGREAEDREAEPSADSFDHMLDQSKTWLQRGEFWAGTDAEQDDADNRGRFIGNAPIGQRQLA